MKKPFLSRLKKRWSLRTRIMVGLVCYLVLLTLGVLANDFVVNERAEAMVWDSLLNAELDHFIRRRQETPDYQWPETETLNVFIVNEKNPLHHELLGLSPGLHDEIMVNGREKVLLIRDSGTEKLVISLDIDELEGNEANLRYTIFISAAIVSILLIMMAAWGVHWLMRPISDLAARIAQLRPEKSRQRIHLPQHSSADLEVIVDSMNDYIERNERFVERERDFINMVSHELRTPMTVMAGALQFSLHDTDTSPDVRARLQDVKRTLDDMSEMVALLLVLAKDPARLDETSEMIFLHQLLPEIMRDYSAMADAKQLTLEITALPEVEIHAPLLMVKCAIGNLLRNAIENSYQGMIRLSLDPHACLTISNKPEGISPEEISRIYTRHAREPQRRGGGIGLDLIFRLCAHCRWQLAFSPSEEHFNVNLTFPSTSL